MPVYVCVVIAHLDVDESLGLQSAYVCKYVDRCLHTSTRVVEPPNTNQETTYLSTCLWYICHLSITHYCTVVGVKRRKSCHVGKNCALGSLYSVGLTVPKISTGNRL